MNSFYVGNYTSSGLNLLNEIFKPIYKTNDFCNPSYICQNKNMVYCITETFPGNIVAYHNTGSSLNFVNSIETNFDGPCFITLDSIRNILYIANYTHGSILAFQINKDCSIGKELYYKNFGDNSHIHHICFSSDNSIIFITDLGNNIIFAYKINYADGILNLIEITSFIFPTETEPRHIVVDDSNNLYIVTESSCKLYHIHFVYQNKFELVGTYSILPNNIVDFNGSTGCAIKLSCDKKFIYISIRGHNSISVFSLKDCIPTLIQNISCKGNNPRDIEFCFSEKLLLCANYHSNDISLFERDIQTGLLKYKNSIHIDSPSCILEHINN